MLYSTKIKLELITDQSILEFFESQVRGGVSTVFHRYAEFNNPYLPDFNPSNPKSYISYIDACNLYGWQCLKSYLLETFNGLLMKNSNINLTS